MKGCRTAPEGARVTAAMALRRLNAVGDRAIGADEVAKTLGYSTAWFYRNRRRLERDHGFPPPVAGTRHWSAARLGSWLAGEQDHQAGAAAAQAAAWAARLEARIPDLVAQIKPARRNAA